MNLSPISGRDFRHMLIVIGLFCLLHVRTAELRLPVHFHFWKEVVEMNSTQEFIQKYVNKGAVEDQFRKVIVKQRKSNGLRVFQGYENTLQGSIRQEPSSMQLSSFTPCYPLNASVPVPNDPDPSYERVPPCAILPRCGGCCGPVYTCLPTSIVQISVMVYRGIPGPDPNFAPVNVTMDSHTACACSCGIQASDCNPETHIFNSEECSCLCQNETSCSSQKIWNKKECRCKCRNVIDCLDDEVFDFSTCSCESKP